MRTNNNFHGGALFFTGGTILDNIVLGVVIGDVTYVTKFHYLG